MIFISTYEIETYSSVLFRIKYNFNRRFTLCMHADSCTKVSSQRDDAFKELLPTFRIRPASWLHFVHEVVVPISQSPQHSWYWPKRVLRSGWLYVTSRPIFFREMWFVDCHPSFRAIVVHNSLLCLHIWMLCFSPESRYCCVVGCYDTVGMETDSFLWAVRSCENALLLLATTTHVLTLQTSSTVYWRWWVVDGTMASCVPSSRRNIWRLMPAAPSTMSRN